MASNKINARQLSNSIDLLTRIANDSYNDSIRPVALQLWKKHLRPQNPQWTYISGRPFFIDGKNGGAHVMAMIDSRLPGKGLVGYFACSNADLGAKVLQQAATWLKNTYGVTSVYGPINGTLPSDYRLNLSDDWVFPGEPVNPLWHIDAFYKAGFEVFNRYASGKLRYYHPILKFSLRKPSKEYAHMRIRQFDTQQTDQDFEIYHHLRNQIFPFQSIYCPAISLDERKYITGDKFDPGYTYFLMDGDREVGFIMAYQYQDQLILKTIGLLPEYRGKRLANLLLKPVHDHAHEAGLKTAIYGMVRVGNQVYKNKHPLAKEFRHYVTMQLSLR